MSKGYPIDTINEIEAKNSGRHFFSADTLRFFNSRIYPAVIDHRFFVTTERAPSAGSRRLATLRMIRDDGNVDTIGEFQQFRSPAAAISALRKAQKEGVEVRHDPYDDVTDPENPRAFNYRAYVGELPVGSRTSLWWARRLAAQARRPAYTG